MYGMKVSSSDMYCRYLAALGTGTEELSPFGIYLKSQDIEVPRDCSLDYMVRAGWIAPVLRVLLPRSGFESWENYPESPDRGTDRCPAEDSWGLDLWTRALMQAPWGGDGSNWWLHFLDDTANSLNQKVRANAIDPGDEGLLPVSFVHPQTGREIKPWMDFFAYWQAYQVAELLFSATGRYYVTPGFENRIAVDPALEFVAARARGIRKKWEKRRPTFEWLSRFRTILAAGMDREGGDCTAIAKDNALQQGLTPEQMTTEIRETLLVSWQDFDGMGSALPGRDKLRASLRQDIEYALYLLQILSGRPIDFLAPDWTYPDRCSRHWAQLIDALPRDVELSRKRFSDFALAYLDESPYAPGGNLPLDAKAIDDLLGRFWNISRALRRFCLAFFRMHQELGHRGSASGGDVIHSNEVIEQMIATILNAEKLNVSVHRKRSPNGRQPGTPSVARDQLCRLLTKFKLGKGGIQARSMSGLDRLIKKKGKLHGLDKRGPLFVCSTDIGSGSDDADYFAAAHANFIIARNYAAHHDILDEAFVMPDLDPSRRLGRIAMQSTVTVVLTSLQTA